MGNRIATQDTTETLVNIALGPDWSINTHVSAWLWAAAILLIVLLFVLRRILNGSFFQRDYEIDSTELGLGDSKITFKPNLNDKSVAYKIWVELSTRKIGLPIDFDHDVIVEVYDSWYSFFSVTRDLIKDIPVSKVRGRSTKKIIQLSIDVLNEGIRPHLTTWQARFRRWFDHKLSTDPEAKFDPQDVQKEFPKYAELVADMRAVNARLMKYRERMDALVHS